MRLKLNIQRVTNPRLEKLDQLFYRETGSIVAIGYRETSTA